MSDTPIHPTGAPEHPSEHGLKSGAIGFWSALVLGLNSTAPAYSLAAILGILAFEVGVQAPAALLISFVPMLFIATAYYAMNRADPDCGTTFAWASRALGPFTGWAAGWAIMTAGIIVIGLLANTAATYTFLLFDWDSAAGEKWAVIALAVAMIVVLTWVTVIGIEVSARTQDVLIVFQMVGLLVFAVVVLARVVFGDGGATSVDPDISWFSPTRSSPAC
jgi:amino acid transporter